MFDVPKLNAQQQKAVSAVDGAVLVVACAGTGKTKVLTSRIANIVLSGRCLLSEILAVTFTNKAAREMIQRSVELLKQNGYTEIVSPWIGTFHSLALRIIRPLYEKFERTADFNVIKPSEQIKLMKQLMQNNGFSDEIFSPRDLLLVITNWKEQCLLQPRPKTELERIALKLVKPYEDELKRLNVIDFSDILRYSIYIFKTDRDILQYYQGLFRYIMVDEYQDTNVAQYVWLRLLAGGHGNICCVGDDDQSIYGWRGADLSNILNFSKDFKNAQVIKLELNYRSTSNILNVASSVISHNKNRIRKTFKSNTNAGLPVMLTRASDPTDEAQIISNIISVKIKHGYKYNDFAVLVRTTVQIRELEEVFMASSIPYTLADGVQFYERTEVKDVIAYLKLLVNPNDEIAFKRIVNVPRRGIGAVSVLKLYELANERQLPVSDAAMISGNKKLIDFFNMISEWRSLMHQLSIQELVSTILKRSGYLDMINARPENDEVLNILDDLMLALKQYNTVREFLDYVSLATERLTINKNSVSISTIHAAKGLEYNVIFIPGFEDGILPHQRSFKERDGIEEERRLFYVALTRARKEVFISMCDTRSMYGLQFEKTQFGNRRNILNTRPSRFLLEMPSNCIRWF